MPNRINADTPPMDHRTSAAVCDGIGERLRDVLRPSVTELPPHLQELMERLHQLDTADAPPIVPTLEAMIGTR